MLLDLVPEKRQDKTRDQVSDILTERIESGDLNALTQFARFHWMSLSSQIMKPLIVGILSPQL